MLLLSGEICMFIFQKIKDRFLQYLDERDVFERALDGAFIVLLTVFGTISVLMILICLIFDL